MYLQNKRTIIFLNHLNEINMKIKSQIKIKKRGQRYQRDIHKNISRTGENKLTMAFQRQKSTNRETTVYI